MFVIEYECGWTGRDMTKLCHEDTLEEAIKNIETEEKCVGRLESVVEVEKVQDCVDPCALMILYDLEGNTEGSEYFDNPDLYMKTLETKGWLLDGQPDHKRADKEVKQFLEKQPTRIIINE